MFNFLKNNKLLIFLDQVLVSGSNFTISILLARFLGIENYGVYSIYWIIVAFSVSIQNAYVIAPMFSIGPTIKEKNIDLYLTSSFYNNLIIIVLVSFFLVILMFGASFFELQWNDKKLIYLVTLVSSLSIFHDFLRRYLIFKCNLVRLLKIDVLSYFGFIILIFIAHLTQNLSVYNVFILYVFSFGFSIFLGVFYLKIKRVDFRYFKVFFLKNLSFSKWLIYSSLLQWGSGNYLVLVAGSLLGSSVVGGVKVIQNLMGVFNVIFLSLENILPIQFSDTFKKEGLGSLFKGFLKYLKIGILIFSSLILLMLFDTSELIIIKVYGSNYLSYSVYIPYFIIITCVIYLGNLLRYLLRTINETKFIFSGYVFSLLFSLLLGTILIKNFKISGLVYGLFFLQLIMVSVMSYGIVRFKRSYYKCKNINS